MITEKDLDKYLAVPYKHQGRDMTGLDCYGLILAIFKEAGIELFDIDEDYTPQWSWKGRNHFIENYHHDWVQVDKPKFLDVVGFHNGQGVVNHAGVMLDHYRFINTCKAGTVICKVSDSVWAKRVQGFYRYKGML